MICRGSKRPQGVQQPLIFSVELAAGIVGHGPDRAHCFARNVERNQQCLFHRRRDRLEIGITSLYVLEQKSSVAVEYVAARSEVARRAAADVRSPHAGYRRPVEPLSAIFQRKQAYAGGAGLAKLQDRVGQYLKNRTRRVCQRARERHKSAVFLLVVGWARPALLQLLRKEDGFQRERAGRNGGTTRVRRLPLRRATHVALRRSEQRRYCEVIRHLHPGSRGFG